MMYKWFLFLLCIISAASEGTNTVKLTVLYRPQCTLCKSFIVNQLWKTWLRFSDFIQPEFIMYVPEFQTQSSKDKFDVGWIPKGDPRLLHMCASYEACGDQGTLGCPIPNVTNYINYIQCDLQGNPLDESAHCATEAGFDPEFKECHNSELAIRLIDYHVKMTMYIHDHFGNEFKTLPLVLINDKFHEEEYRKALHNLTDVMCHYIPGEC